MADEKTSLDLAYQISISSYEHAAKRFDAIDTKIQNLFTFALGFLVIAPSLIKPATTSLSRSFWAAIVLLVIAALLSVYARLYGNLHSLSPQKLFANKGHELQPDEFKRKIIESAGDAYQANKEMLEYKWQLSLLSMAIFGAGLICLIYWLSHQMA
ncbi:MAG TPA: hypothetical protein VF556_07745 [Pyrinomonadaceae bacterium]|jgi:hypothetical protein